MATLYVAATPIGNLSDVSPRLLETLGRVALIAAEDTRVTGNLLRHFDIRTPLTSLHRHNEADKANGIVGRMLNEDIDVALVSDAGTPAVSDPGALLVREAANAGIEVVAIAGPSAVTAALSICGFDIRSFAFYGFLPRETSDVKKKLLEIAAGPAVAVLYESPHRVVALMEVISGVLPACRACVCCDLTKRFEKTVRGDALHVVETLKANPNVEKGEYCIVLDLSSVTIAKEAPQPPIPVEGMLFMSMLNGLSPQDAVERAIDSGIRKNDAKRAMLRIKKYLQAL